MTFFKFSAIGSLPLGDNFVTSFHVSSNSPLTTVDLACRGAWDTFWNAITQYLPTATQLLELSTVQLDSTNGKQAFSVVSPASIPGTGAAPDVSQQCCILISLRTASAAKSGRGRQYLPAPVVAATSSNGALSSAAQTAIDTAYGAMVTSINTSHSFVVLHGGYKKLPDGSHRYDPLTSDPVTATKVRNVLATQRRRTNRALVSYTNFRIA
jgi:hypothetical protein